uniref:Uncharacterized protein n=1 Tax=Trichuris muris TaxID=70415 RepID=A0A5S6R3U0_TRIMR
MVKTKLSPRAHFLLDASKRCMPLSPFLAANWIRSVESDDLHSAKVRRLFFCGRCYAPKVPGVSVSLRLPRDALPRKRLRRMIRRFKRKDSASRFERTFIERWESKCHCMVIVCTVCGRECKVAWPAAAREGNSAADSAKPASTTFQQRRKRTSKPKLIPAKAGHFGGKKPCSRLQELYKASQYGEETSTDLASFLSKLGSS